MVLFDPAKSHKVSADSSRGGLGAVLLQREGETDWHPVAYASRSMTAVEQEYLQIEKEALAILFGVVRFQSFLYGKFFEIETDNNPLVSIFNRGISSAPHRIQAFMIKLQRFDFEISWVPRKFIKAADALSQVAKRQHIEELSKDSGVAAHVNGIINGMPISEKVWAAIKVETQRDQLLQRVIKALKQGDKLPGKFNDSVHEITYIDGVLFKGTRVIVPQTLKTEMLSRIHEGHLGMVKCKRRARQSLYWIGMSGDIDSVLKSCDLCMTYQNKNPAQPLTQEHQEKPWFKLAADIFTLGGQDYLVVVDYFSNYPELAPLKNKGIREVIMAMKAMFSRPGIPLSLTSDNVPFKSHEFVEFAEYYGFNFEPASPHHPNSNGKAEKAVQIVKRLLQKCFEKGEDPYLAILNYRSAPLECGRSPSQLLMSRELKTRLPQAQLQHAEQPYEAMDKIRRSRACQKFYHDKNTRVLKSLDQGQVVRIYDRQRKIFAEKAVVLKEHSHNSYLVLTERGSTLRRNRDQLKETLEQFVPQVDVEYQPVDCVSDVGQQVCQEVGRSDGSTESYSSGSELDQQSVPQDRESPSTQVVDADPDLVSDSVDPLGSSSTMTSPRRSQRLRRKPQRLGIEEM